MGNWGEDPEVEQRLHDDVRKWAELEKQWARCPGCQVVRQTARAGVVGSIWDLIQQLYPMPDAVRATRGSVTLTFSQRVTSVWPVRRRRVPFRVWCSRGRCSCQALDLVRGVGDGLRGTA